MTELLTARGWTEATERDHEVGLLFLDGLRNLGNRAFWHLKSQLKSLLDTAPFSNKVDLHIALSAQMPDAIPETHVVDPSTTHEISDGDLWIWRPEGGHGGGQGIHVVSSQAEVENLRKADLSWDSKALPSRAILSRYITEPQCMLDGKKFHLRIFFGVVVDAGRVRTYVWKSGEIYTSRHPFALRDFANKDVHDSHVAPTLENGHLKFPDDYPVKEGHGAAHVLSQIESILRKVSEIYAPAMKKYNESDGAFEIYGCDFMVNARGEVKLIEINNKPGWKTADDEARLWQSKNIFGGVYDIAIGPKYESGFVRKPNSGVVELWNSEQGSGERHTRIISASNAARQFDPQRKTYLLMVEMFSATEFLKICPEAEWRSVTIQQAIQAGHVDLVFVDGWKMFDKRLWKVRSTFKSRVTAVALTNKIDLHLMLARRGFVRHVPETIYVDPRETTPALPDASVPWIFRGDERAGGGAGVHVVSTQEQFVQVHQDFLAAPTSRGSTKRALLSRFISEPLLVCPPDSQSLYKFHLRLFLLVVVTGRSEKNRVGLFRDGEIALAKNPFVEGDNANVSAQDTHLENAPPLRFPNDYPGGEGPAAAVFERCVSLFTDVAGCCLQDLEVYEECEVGFQILGADVLVDRDGRPWLMEINQSPGFDDLYPGRKDIVTGYLLRGISAFVLGWPDEALPGNLVQLEA